MAVPAAFEPFAEAGQHLALALQRALPIGKLASRLGERPHDLLDARVMEVGGHLGRQPAEAAHPHQPGQVRGEQAERRVDVAVDEAAHLPAVELGDEVDVPPEECQLLIK